MNKKKNVLTLFDSIEKLDESHKLLSKENKNDLQELFRRSSNYYGKVLYQNNNFKKK